jgi:uncharacterized membrane protein
MTARITPGAVFAWALAVFFVAGCVHLSSILLMPRLAPKDAFTRLADIESTGGGFAIVPPARPGKAAIPFADSATILAMCRYDLTKGPWRVRATVDDESMVSLSFHGRTGAVFHSLTDRAALRGHLDVVVATADQIETIEAGDVEDAPPQDIRITSPAAQGFVLLRAMPGSPAGEARLRARIAATGCAPEG